jgi:hypothetical protein
MAAATKFSLVFDVEKKKCSLDGGPFVRFKGCTSKEKIKEIIADSHRKGGNPKDDEPPPPPGTGGTGPELDGYFYCDVGGTETWHFVTTTPPITDTDLQVGC